MFLRAQIKIIDITDIYSTYNPIIQNNSKKDKYSTLRCGVNIAVEMFHRILVDKHAKKKMILFFM